MSQTEGQTNANKTMGEDDQTTCSDTVNPRRSSRVPKPTPDALIENARRLKAARSVACGKVTAKTNEIRALRNSEEGKDDLSTLQKKVEEWDEVMENLALAHKKYMECLSTEERQDDAETWAVPIFNGFEVARKDVHMYLRHLKEDQEADIHDIDPGDSVSEVSLPLSKVSRSTSHGSHSSTRSSVLVARANAMAKKAELLARASALKKKKALEEKALSLQQQRRDQEMKRKEEEMKRKEEEMKMERQREEEERKRKAEEDNIRYEQEQLAMETELAATNARILALDEVTMGSVCNQGKELEGNDSNNVNTQPIYDGVQPNLNPEASVFIPSSPQEASIIIPSSPQDASVSVPSSPQQPQNVDFTSTNSASTPDTSMLDMVKQQGQLTKMLSETYIKSTLPKRSIPIFDGNPLDYGTWLTSFEHGVERKCTNAREKLFYMEQFTAGEVNRVVRSYMRKDPEIGYKQAKEAITERYGNRYKLANAYLKKADALPDVKSEDATSLNDMSLFLLECQNVMEDLDYMNELNHPKSIQMLVAKLPYKLRGKWRALTDDIQEEKKRVVRFDDLVKFVNKQARIARNPIYGNINTDKPRGALVTDRPKSRPRHKRSFATGTTTRTASTDNTIDKKCLYCDQGSHTLEVCKKLASKPSEERIKFLKAEGLCFGCLKKATHLCKNCTNKLTCKHCNKRHPTVLHYERPAQSDKSSQGREKSEPASVKENTSTICGLTGAGVSGCLPAVIPVQVRAKESGVVISTYAFLDDGSNTVFCTDKLQRQLKVTGKRTQLSIETINQTKKVNSLRLKDLEVMDMYGNNVVSLPEVYTQSHIPASKKDVLTKDDIKSWPYLDKVTIPTSQAEEVGLLIGNNVPKAIEPLEVINSQGDGPFACKTLLGWVVHGVPGSDPTRSTVVNRVIVHEQMDRDLVNMYNQEFSERLPEEQPQRSREDLKFLDLVSDSLNLVEDHYEIGLPLRHADVVLPDNKPLAEQRAAHLKKKFGKDQRFKEEYVTFMNGMLEKGFADEVPDAEQDRADGKVWYVPHHGVFHPQKNKIRVVFDCAASYKGKSLNKELLQGPDLTSSLVGVLLRFQEERVALMADIEGMFNQVRIPAADRDLLRFLWWPNGDINKPLQVYRMGVHVFGATSSPACANYALRKAAEDGEGRYDQAICDTIRRNFYVDDCLKSVATNREAIHHVHGLRQLCGEKGFRLTKWISSERKVIEAIPPPERAKEAQVLDLAMDNLPSERALGVLWCAQSDSFGFDINLRQKPPTRRGILSMVSSIYDPLGFIAPCTLPAKILMQDLCRLKLPWDEEIPCDHQLRWQEWVDELPQLVHFSLERCYKPPGFEEPVTTQLHHFSDASENGYGTASYIRLINDKGDIHCRIVLGKARVAPLKQITIPRLELTAATVAVRVDSMLQRELQLKANSFFWTDSTSVLRYINNERTRFHTFVANRIAIISEGTRPEQWRYVPTALNPADECSRGQSVSKFLRNERWKNGPSFLSKHESEWPPADVESLTRCSSADPEVKVAANVVHTNEAQDILDKLMNRYSSWFDLRKAVAWILRVKHQLLLRAKARKLGNNSNREQHVNVSDADSTAHRPSVDEMQAAEEAILCCLQRSSFREEVAALETKGDIRAKQHVKKSSPTYRLDPIMHNGLMRVGGRLSKSAMPEESKHQLVLPKGHHVVQLILREIHERSGHVGRSHMLARFRQKYWAAGSNTTARRVISDCVVCKRQRGKVQQQKMADLPADRVTPDDPPFTTVGMDYFGPFEVKRGRSMVKRYGVIFTCMTTRAVHIEMADSLNTDSCLNAIRRFVARRGQIKELRSDNGTNLVGANKVLKAEIDSWNQAQIHESLLQKGIKWTFNPPAASHFGGIWERQIRTIRKVMLSVLKEQTMNDDSLHTLFCEVEAIINSRPITKVSEDPNDLEALTPNHLLLMKVKPNMPPTTTSPTDKYARRRWRQVQYLADLFWRRWTREYLPQLQERQKWVKPEENVEVGDVVLVVDNSAPRNSWPMGRVTKTHPDEQGHVRSVEIKTKNGLFKRPVCKLVRILECDNPDHHTQ